MKKILLIILIYLFSINIVSAKESKLIISGNDNKMYYDSDFYDTNMFMSHLDIIPGSVFTDILEIENETNFTFNLYLKISYKNYNELLEYLNMKLYLDNKLIYDGDMKGPNVENSHNDLKNAIFIDKLIPHKKYQLKVVTNLSYEYSNILNNDKLISEWNFFAETFDELNNQNDSNKEKIIQIIPAPKTGIKKNMIPIVVFSGSLCLVGLVIIILLFKKRNKDDNNEKNY